MSARTEADDFGAFARRIVRAYSKRVADRDIAALGGLARLREELDTATRYAVANLRSQGYSWADIGRELGITRQGAFQRYGRCSCGLAVEHLALPAEDPGHECRPVCVRGGTA